MFRCACNQKSAVCQDNKGRISSCLGPSSQSSDLKTPLSGLRLRRSPKVGCTNPPGNAMATSWGLLWLALVSAHLTSYESTRKSSRRWHQPKSSHFCWPVLLHLMHRWGTCHFCSILISCTLQFNCNNCWNVWEFLIGTALVRNTQPCDFL